jgi:quinol monooxygenase YgiN
MVRSNIRMLLPLKKLSEAQEILGSMIEQIQFEPGCMSCRLYRDVQEECALMLDETWTSEKDLLRHLQSDRYRRVLLVVEMSAEPPEIRFDTIAHSSGVETIEQARA